jgi:RNA polymerase sigma-70 factor, ECF subfamily
MTFRSLQNCCIFRGNSRQRVSRLDQLDSCGVLLLSSDATEGAMSFVAMRRPVSSSDAAPAAAAQAAVSDEDLILRVRGGDDRALGLLFERYARMVLAVGYRVLRDPTEAEELVQDAFLYIREKAKLFNPAKGTAKTWVMQVAYHRSLDRRVLLKKHSLLNGTNVEEIYDSTRGKCDIEQELGAKYDAEQLKKAFGQLSERQRLTLQLYFFEGMTLREIGQRLDEPLENVRHHYYRALGKLRKSSALAVVRKERFHES